MALIGVVVCGAGPASDVGKLIQLLHERSHDVRIIATPSAVPFLDLDGLETMTGRPVRSQHRKPGEPRSSEKTFAYIVAPATFNTINKLATGISDTYALDVINEAIGLGLPIVVLPFVNSALASRPSFVASTAQLVDEGVVILGADDGINHHRPGSGGQAQHEFPWHGALSHLNPSR